MAVQDGVRGGPSKRIFAQAIAFLKRRRARRRRGPARELLEARGSAHAGALRARAGGPDDAQAVLQGPGLALAAQWGSASGAWLLLGIAQVSSPSHGIPKNGKCEDSNFQGAHALCAQAWPTGDHARGR